MYLSSRSLALTLFLVYAHVVRHGYQNTYRDYTHKKTKQATMIKNAAGPVFTSLLEPLPKPTWYMDEDKGCENILSLSLCLSHTHNVALKEINLTHIRKDTSRGLFLEKRKIALGESLRLYQSNFKSFTKKNTVK